MDELFPVLPPERVDALSSLALAHVGDAVFELLVRSRLAAERGSTAESLHRETVRLVNAASQAAFARLLLPKLTEEEAAVYRRGRNAHVNSVPKHMTVGDYHAATGFEALFGWLWLLGRRERIAELWESIWQQGSANREQ